MAPIIQLRAIEKIYEMGHETVVALRSIDLVVEANEYIAVTGTSGSGKSTMMNIIGCLDSPTSGSYFLDGQNVALLNDAQLATVRGRRIGFVFQNFNLLSRATALQNVMQPLVYQNVPAAERKARAGAALARVGLADRADHRPNQLSGGQRQRVAIARALCTNPSLLLADEPTGNLDSTTTADIMSLFDQLHSEGHTLVIVTHEKDVAAHCRRQINLRDGEIDFDQATNRRA